MIFPLLANVGRSLIKVITYPQPSSQRLLPSRSPTPRRKISPSSSTHENKKKHRKISARNATTFLFFLLPFPICYRWLSRCRSCNSRRSYSLWKMEPDHAGAAEQNSPRGNDWEVVQLTASNYASVPGPPRSEPYHEEEAEGQEYGAKGDDSAAAALLMSGHFSVSQNEAEEILKGADSKERQEVCGSQYAVSDKDGDVRYEAKKLKDDFDRIPSFDKGSSIDMETDDGNTLHGVHLASEDPVKFSSHGDAEKELSWSATGSKTEEPIMLHNLGPATGSSKVASGEHNKPDGSGVPRDACWRKQIISLYRSAKESNKLWPIFVAAAALMGMAYFRRRWQKGKLQLQQVKLQPASSKERINRANVPLNRIKDILVAGNHSIPAPHGHARLS